MYSCMVYLLFAWTEQVLRNLAKYKKCCNQPRFPQLQSLLPFLCIHMIEGMVGTGTVGIIL